MERRDIPKWLFYAPNQFYLHDIHIQKSIWSMKGAFRISTNRKRLLEAIERCASVAINNFLGHIMGQICIAGVW